MLKWKISQAWSTIIGIYQLLKLQSICWEHEILTGKSTIYKNSNKQTILAIIPNGRWDRFRKPNAFHEKQIFSSHQLILDVFKLSGLINEINRGRRTLIKIYSLAAENRRNRSYKFG